MNTVNWVNNFNSMSITKNIKNNNLREIKC